MLPFSWSSRILRSSFSPKASRQKPASCRLAIEVLEDRALMSVTPLHLYNLNGTLTDQLGGPALVSDGGALTADRYVFGPNQGLRLTGGLADTTNYSIVMVANLNTVTSFFKKVIDFQSRSSDAGLYVVGTHLDLYPGNPGPGNVLANQDFHLALTRDSATGATLIYLNGVLDMTYFGSNVAIPLGNVLTFFEDDNVTRGEAVAGSVDYIAIYDRPLTAAEVGELVNAPPVVSPTVNVNLPAVTVNEGQTALNTGTWTNAVSMTASIGSVTQNSGGTWSWSFSSYDGPNQSQTVTITALGASGLSATTSFQLTVNNVAPVLTLAGAAAVNEGAAYVLSLSANDPGADSIHTWTINWGDGVIQNVPGNPNSATHVYADGPNNYTISASAADEDGAYSASNNVGVTVNNVAPTANLGNNGPITYSQSATVSFTSQSDPSNADTTAGFHYAYSLTGDFIGVTYENGSGTSSTQNFSGLNAGDNTVYARIIDRDNGFTQYTTVVSVRKATLTVTADAKVKTYDGAVFGPFTATVTGFVSGEHSGVVSGTAGFTGPATTAIHAGEYTITPTLGTLSAANYDFTFVSSTLTINKATSTTTAFGATFTYDGTVRTGGSGTVTGAGGLNVAATSLTYSGDQVNAGTYLVTAHYAGDANHFGSVSAPAIITIEKANAVITIVSYNGAYDGAAHGISGSAIGVESIPANLSSLLNLGATFTDVPGGTATWTFAGNANYHSATGTAAVTITKAPTITTAVGGTFTYDGAAHGGSGSVNVAGGVVTITYVGINGTNYSSVSPPTNAGTYSVIATYAGDANHASSVGSATLRINPKLLNVTAWSQGTINIGSNGSIVLHLAIDSGQFYNSDTVLSLFNGATFTIKIQNADGSATYATLTSVATVESDGSIRVSMQMSDSLRAELYDAYLNGRAVNFNMTATANGGNYILDEGTVSRLLNNGALRYVV